MVFSPASECPLPGCQCFRQTCRLKLLLPSTFLVKSPEFQNCSASKLAQPLLLATLDCRPQVRPYNDAAHFLCQTASHMSSCQAPSMSASECLVVRSNNSQIIKNRRCRHLRPRSHLRPSTTTHHRPPQLAALCGRLPRLSHCLATRCPYLRLCWHPRRALSSRPHSTWCRPHRHRLWPLTPSHLLNLLGRRNLRRHW